MWPHRDLNPEPLLDSDCTKHCHIRAALQFPKLLEFAGVSYGAKKAKVEAHLKGFLKEMRQIPLVGRKS